MAHLAIAGGTGFIGSSIVRAFLQEGWGVTVLLRPKSSTRRIDEIPGWEGLEVDSLSSKTTARRLAARKPDVFIQAGWKGVAGSHREDTSQFIENIPLTLASVKLASDSGCQHWIGLGSQAEYGKIDGKISETDPTVPLTAYGKTKLAAGIVGTGLAENLGMKASWTRVFSTYGPGDASHWLIPQITEDLLSGVAPKVTKGEQLWDYLFVEDCAQAVLSVASKGAGGTFNLGSGSAIPIRKVIETIHELIEGAPLPDFGGIPYRPDQGMHLEADISRLAAATGWKPQVPLDVGIARTVEDIRQRKREATLK